MKKTKVRQPRTGDSRGSAADGSRDPKIYEDDIRPDGGQQACLAVEARR